MKNSVFEIGIENILWMNKMENIEIIHSNVKHCYVPKDVIEFGTNMTDKLNAAVYQIMFLIKRGYDTKSATTYVGNYYLLSERQRIALARITSTQDALERRERKRLLQPSESLVLDGFNTIRAVSETLWRTGRKG